MTDFTKVQQALERRGYTVRTFAAAAEAAAMNVFVNTGLLAPADRAETEARAEHLCATVVQCCAQTVDAVLAALRGEG